MHQRPRDGICLRCGLYLVFLETRLLLDLFIYKSVDQIWNPMFRKKYVSGWEPVKRKGLNSGPKRSNQTS